MGRGSLAAIWLWPTGLALAPPTDMGYETKGYETNFVTSCVPIILGLVGVTLRNFTRRDAGVITWVQVMEGLPQQNLGGQNRPKFVAISDNFQP